MRLFIKFFAAFAVVAILAITAIWYGGWGSKDATHPALASSDLAPVIPVGEFFANIKSKWAYKPSLEGKYLQWREVENFRETIKFRPMDEGEAGKVTTIPYNQGARHFWANDDSAFYLIQRESKLSRTVLWKIDPENPSEKWQDVTPRGFGNWNIFYRALDGKGPWYVASRDRNPAMVDIYSVNPDGSGKKLLIKNDGQITDWRFDILTGKPIARYRLLEKELFALETPPASDPFARDAKWQESFRYTGAESLNVLTAADNGKVFAASRRGRDKSALVSLDLRTGEEEVIAENSVGDLRRSFIIAGKSQVDIAEFSPDYRKYIATSKLGERVLSLLDDGSGPFHFNLLGQSKHGELLTFAVSRQEDSWEYVLIDTKNNIATISGKSPFAVHAEYLADTRPVTFKARDGLEIPAFLTLPYGVEAKGLPVVVMAHGGPAASDWWAYNHEKQFLANRGYAVFSINFRGSTGYGRKFQEAGFRQFGRKMQDDLVDGAKWLIAEGIADREKIAIYGRSYGGYAAMMGVARDADIFAAGISVVGATDMEYQTVNAPHFWGLGIESWTRYFGSAENDDDVALMRKYSPVNMVEQIKVPVFVAHGVNDRVVDRAQSEAFEKNLKKHGKEYEVLYLENEGHGFRRWQSKIIYYTQLEEFLAKHLGGRTGGFHYSLLGAKWMN